MSTTNLSSQKNSKVILGPSSTSSNKPWPLNCSWANQFYKDGVANNWVPQEISMQSDIRQWNSPNSLTPAERKLILWNLGFFSTAETLTGKNLMVISLHITNFECYKYIVRQAFEETVHSETFEYCCSSLGLNEKEIFNMYQTIPSVAEKDNFAIELTQAVSDPSFQINNDHDLQLFLRDLIVYYVIMEGIFFYAGFAMMLALKRVNKMIGIGQQFEFILKDESLHLGFGCSLINTITGAKPQKFGKGDCPQVWTKDFKNEITELIKKAVELEKKYVLDACPEGVAGIGSQQFCEYVEYVANRRLDSIGLSKVYFVNEVTKEEVRNPFPWMSQSTDLNKEKNFFETRLTEYQTGTLEWEEEEEK